MSEISKANAKANLAGKKKEHHPRWRHDLTDNERDRTRDQRHKDWSKVVLTNNGYQCFICGERGYLHAHHLRSYSIHKEHRYNPRNGICLCKPCHDEFHKTYSYRCFDEHSFCEFAGLPGIPPEFLEPAKMDDFRDALPHIRDIAERLVLAGSGISGIDELQECLLLINREIEKRTKETPN